MDAERLLRFESFELDVRSRELRKGKNRIRLQEQPFEILAPDARAARRRRHPRGAARSGSGRSGTFVDFEHSLNAAVKRLRAALGDDADNPRFVETLPRRGYRFIASLRTAARPSRSLPVTPDYKARLAVLPFANLSGDPSRSTSATA